VVLPRPVTATACVLAARSGTRTTTQYLSIGQSPSGRPKQRHEVAKISFIEVISRRRRAKSRLNRSLRTRFKRSMRGITLSSASHKWESAISGRNDLGYCYRSLAIPSQYMGYIAIKRERHYRLS
jgi:hypothetical protein